MAVSNVGEEGGDGVEVVVGCVGDVV